MHQGKVIYTVHPKIKGRITFFVLRILFKCINIEIRFISIFIITMLLISKNSTNICYLTLRELSSVALMPATATTNYLFVFSSYLKGMSFSFIPTPVSSNTVYDVFRITESGSTFVDLIGGTISMHPGMYYYYEVYEQTNDSYNLDISAIVKDW
jgi:hypothetical protein